MSDRTRLRLAILRVLVLSLVCTLLGRLWYLQVMASDEYRALAMSNRTRPVVEAAPRGRLLDDRGRSLVRNRTSLVVTVDSTALGREPDKGAAVLARLSAVLKVPVNELRSRIRPCGGGVFPPCWNGSPYQPVPVQEDVPPAVALKIQEHQEDFPGVEAKLRPVRWYPYRTAAAHVLGYISPVSEEELKTPRYADHERTDLVGRSGLEQTYDRDLRGRSGKQIVAVDSAGRVTGVVREEPPVPGNDVVLSLDADVQRITDAALAKAIMTARRTYDERGESGNFKAPSGAAVVMEAQTGHVVAMSSFPTYDPSVFTGGVSKREYQALTSEASGYPLTSRATQGLFAPASTFKIVTTASAVMGGAPLHGYYACPGVFRLGTARFHNFDSASLGSITLRTSLVKSCDTVYYKFAADDYFRDEARVEAGGSAEERMQRMARAFGFGRETGVDLPSEADGRIVDRAFKQRRWEQNRDVYCTRAKNGYPEVADAARRALLHQLAVENCADGNRYRGGDHVNFSIGQGETVVTPLQLAVAYAALANGGKVFEPKIAKAVVSPEGKVLRRIVPPVRNRLNVSPEVLAYMREALTAVTTEGTAESAFVGFEHDKLRVAGKTGTGQVFGKQDTAWFASFAPAENPRYVVVAMIEQAGTGGAAAAPAVREIYEGIYGLGGKKAALPGGLTPTELPTVMPDGSVRPPRITPPKPPVAVPAVTPTPFARRRARG